MHGVVILKNGDGDTGARYDRVDAVAASRRVGVKRLRGLDESAAST